MSDVDGTMSLTNSQTPLKYSGFNYLIFSPRASFSYILIGFYIFDLLW